MAFVTGRCPNCSGEIQLDESKESGFCLHCGSHVQVQEAIARLKVELSGKVSLEGMANIKDLKEHARRCFDIGQYGEAERLWNKIVTEAEPKDYESWWGIVEVSLKSKQHILIPDSNKAYTLACAYAPKEALPGYNAAVAEHNKKIYYKQNCLKKADRCKWGIIISALVYVVSGLMVSSLLAYDSSQGAGQFALIICVAAFSLMIFFIVKMVKYKKIARSRWQNG